MRETRGCQCKGCATQPLDDLPTTALLQLVTRACSLLKCNRLEQLRPSRCGSVGGGRRTLLPPAPRGQSARRPPPSRAPAALCKGTWCVLVCPHPLWGHVKWTFMTFLASIIGNTYGMNPYQVCDAWGNAWGNTWGNTWGRLGAGLGASCIGKLRINYKTVSVTKCISLHHILTYKTY
jgi:hypothetical protein